VTRGQTCDFIGIKRDGLSVFSPFFLFSPPSCAVELVLLSSMGPMVAEENPFDSIIHDSDPLNSGSLVSFKQDA
jgi:hypothetical protein